MLQAGEVARMLGVSPNTVRDYVRRGWLSCVFSTMVGEHSTRKM